MAEAYRIPEQSSKQRRLRNKEYCDQKASCIILSSDRPIFYFFYNRYRFQLSECLCSPGLASSLSPPEGTTSLPPGLINFTPHTCAPTHHSQLVSITVDYLCTSPPSLCLPRLTLITCMYFSLCSHCERSRSVLCARDTSRLWCPIFEYCFVFACLPFIY